MSESALQNITIQQGAPYTDPFVYTDEAGDPVDLTGFSAILTARKYNGGPVVFEWSTTEGTLTIPTPTDGQIVPAVGAATTAAYDFSKIVYDMFIYNDSDVPTKLIRGYAKLERSETDNAD